MLTGDAPMREPIRATYGARCGCCDTKDKRFRFRRRKVRLGRKPKQTK